MTCKTCLKLGRLVILPNNLCPSCPPRKRVPPSKVILTIRYSSSLYLHQICRTTKLKRREKVNMKWDHISVKKLRMSQELRIYQMNNLKEVITINKSHNLKIKHTRNSHIAESSKSNSSPLPKSCLEIEFTQTLMHLCRKPSSFKKPFKNKTNNSTLKDNQIPARCLRMQLINTAWVEPKIETIQTLKEKVYIINSDNIKKKRIAMSNF